MRVLIFRQQAAVAYLEGRMAQDGSSAEYPLYRRAVELVLEHGARRQQKQLRRMLGRGEVSRFQIDRALGR